jgi:hypothetical protein
VHTTANIPKRKKEKRKKKRTLPLMKTNGRRKHPIKNGKNMSLPCGEF